MKTEHLLLGRRKRLEIRELARQAFYDSECNGDHARVLAEQRIRAAPKSIIASIMIGVAIKLAIDLIAYWIKNRSAAVPSGEFLPDEPGA